jgi:DNA-binding transcriptional ArsR family regulator
MNDLDRVFESVADYFSLLADPTRLKIVHCLCTEERSVNEVVESLGLTQGNTSRHLNLLYRAGILGRRKEGSQVFYIVKDPQFVEICRSVCVAVLSRVDMEAPRRERLAQFRDELHSPPVRTPDLSANPPVLSTMPMKE